MNLYRLHENLLYGNNKRIEKGSVHSLEKLGQQVINILLEKGRISMYRAPPLEALPGFKYRAKRLRKFDMDTIDLYSLSVETIAEKTGLREKLIEKWKCELNDALGIKKEVKKGG